MVASAGLRGWGWPAAAALAAGFIAVLAFHGERTEPGLARFAPAGVLADWPVEQVTSIEVSAGNRHRRFRRISGGGGWRPETADPADVAAVAEQSSAGAEEVSASTQETSASTQEIASSAHDLARTAEELGAMINRFRLAA